MMLMINKLSIYGSTKCNGSYNGSVIRDLCHDRYTSHLSIYYIEVLDQNLIIFDGLHFICYFFHLCRAYFVIMNCCNSLCTCISNTKVWINIVNIVIRYIIITIIIIITCVITFYDRFRLPCTFRCI